MTRQFKFTHNTKFQFTGLLCSEINVYTPFTHPKSALRHAPFYAGLRVAVLRSSPVTSSKFDKGNTAGRISLIFCASNDENAAFMRAFEEYRDNGQELPVWFGCACRNV